MKLKLTLLLLLMGPFLFAQEGYRIEFQLENYEGDTLFLAYYHGNRQFMADTAVSTTGNFVFEGEEALDPGMYIGVRSPERTFFQLLVDNDEMHFSAKGDEEDFVNTVRFTGSPQNSAFYEYLSFLDQQRKKTAELNEERESASERRVRRIERELEEINSEVLSKQSEIIETFDGGLVGAILKGNKEPEIPDFEGAEEEVRRERFKYYKKHFFDNIDLTDERLFRSPVMFAKVNQYMEQLTSRHPDSIMVSLDYILGQMEESPTVFRFYLAHYLNEYARSKIIGMDAVYVHLVDTYYREGRAWWVGEEQLERILENADAIRPTLIGKTAPDITVQKRDGQRVRLHDLDYDYTILYFWRPDCGHCRRYTPQIIDFIREWSDKGVGVVTVCTKFTDEVDTCWEYMDKTEGTDLMLNLVDPFHRSRFSVLYNVRTTPLIFVLDSDKKILSKRLSAQQLSEVMPMFMDDKEGPMNMEQAETGE